MKRLKLKIAMVVVVAAIAGYVTYQNQVRHAISDLALENAEALAAGESGNYDCVKPYTIKCSQEGSVRVPGYRIDK